MTGKTLSVEGMGCGHCKAAVEGELNKLFGVESSNANVEGASSKSTTTRPG